MQCEDGLRKYECGNTKDMHLESTESGQPFMTGFIWDWIKSDSTGKMDLNAN